MDKSHSDSHQKRELVAFWDAFVEIYLDPLLFGFVLFMLFTRIQNIMDYVAGNPQSSFWIVLEIDMHLHPWLYIGFCAVFLLWVASKGIRYRRERQDRKQLDRTLETMSTNIGNLQQTIESLPNRIAEAIESSKNEDSAPK